MARPKIGWQYTTAGTRRLEPASNGQEVSSADNYVKAVYAAIARLACTSRRMDDKSR
jgi:hypothetical protein